MLDCVLISKADDFRQQILDLARHPESHARLTLDLPVSADTMPREDLGSVIQTNPHIAFIDLGDASTTGIRVIQALSEEAPDVAIVAAGPTLTAEGLLSVIRAGATEYLPRPLKDEDTMEAFQRVRRKLSGSLTDEPGVRGRVTTLFSAKGGTGVTVTAANVAVALEEMTRKPTLLLDLAPALGTAALVLGLQPRYSYLDVVQNFHRIDQELLNSFLEVHESGVSVLASPPALSDTQPTYDQVLGLIRFCRRHFAHVVIDAGSSLSGPVKAALVEADERLLVTTSELPSLRNAKRALETAERVVHSNGRGPARVILNQYREGMGISLKEVEEALGCTVFETIERDDDAVEKGLNTGRPIVQNNRSRVARGLIRIGTELAGSDRVESGSSGVIGSLLRPFRSNKS